MKTIAIITMLFLTATAVASFFSMTVFNWSPGPQQRIASPYIWMFFAITTPLTAGVMLIWYMRLRRHERPLEVPSLAHPIFQRGYVQPTKDSPE